MSNGITKENLLFSFPVALRQTEETATLGEITAEELAGRLSEIDKLRIISDIDNLPEELLDILAHDFKVDWWDPNYSVEEKRRTLKGSWRVHRTLGTKAAVETAIRAIYPHTEVEEWFTYGGEPYHFRLNINITSDSGDKGRQRRVLERLNFYKSLRSHNDGVRYFLMPEKSWGVAGGGYVGSHEEQQAKIRIPLDRLKRPGGKTTIHMAGGLAGSWRRIDAAATVPELTRPRGAAERSAGAGFLGSRERAGVRVAVGNIVVPTGRAATSGSAGVFHIYQKITRRVTINGTLEGRSNHE